MFGGWAWEGRYTSKGRGGLKVARLGSPTMALSWSFALCTGLPSICMHLHALTFRSLHISLGLGLGGSGCRVWGVEWGQVLCKVVSFIN